MTATPIRTVDLFAGAGGLSLGFHLADKGFEPVFAVEHEIAAAATFQRNFGCEVFAGDIELAPDYPPADVIIGGPPCQGFSPLGRDRDDLSRAKLNGLWKHYLDAVRTLRPKAFVIENVPEFQKSAQFAELLHLLDTDTELSAYTAAYGVLNAADYGVPQTRRRGILVAIRDAPGELPWPPPPTHGPDSPGERPYVTVKEAFAEPADADNGNRAVHRRRDTAPPLRPATATRVARAVQGDPEGRQPVRPDGASAGHHTELLAEQADRHHRRHGSALG